MVSDRQKKESAPPVVVSENGSGKTMYFLAEVCFIFLDLIFPLIIIILLSRKNQSYKYIFLISFLCILNSFCVYTWYNWLIA